MSDSYTREELEKHEKLFVLRKFDADVAWELGSIIRSITRKKSITAVIQIYHTNSNRLLFSTCSRPGTTLEDDILAKKMLNAVLRYGRSTRLLGNQRFGLNIAEDCTTGGGGFPIRVVGVEGIVGVVAVCAEGIWSCHQYIVDGFKEYSAKNSGGEHEYRVV